MQLCLCIFYFPFPNEYYINFKFAAINFKLGALINCPKNTAQQCTGWLVHILFLLPNIIYNFPSTVHCPDGYRAMTGDVHGRGLKHGYITTNASACGTDCNYNSQCKSFSFSLHERKCKLMREGSPTKNEQYKDYRFCSKIGKFLCVNNIYSAKFKYYLVITLIIIYFKI